jgi:hypothetical protein
MTKFRIKQHCESSQEDATSILPPPPAIDPDSWVSHKAASKNGKCLQFLLLAKGVKFIK